MSAPAPAESLPGARRDPTGLAPLIARIEEWFQGTRCFPQVERDRESIADLLRQVQERQASLDTPLRVLLLGGTGVGKSTVFNALGGADLAKAAPVRPTTRELTAYYHESNGSASLGALEAQAHLVSHARPLLRDKVVIDAPDFDSTALENRVLLEKALEVTDLALCVVTGEKYLSSELFALLQQYQEGVAYVFVLNKLDRTNNAETIAQDLREELARHGIQGARVLCVSALVVRQAQEQAEVEGRSTLEGIELPAEAGAWGELRALLEHELDRVRIREIKAAKLMDRVRGVLSRLEERVPEDAPARVEAWRHSWAGSLRDLSQDLSETFFGAIRSDVELRNVLRYQFGTAFSGAFGAFLALTYGLRALLVPGYLRARTFGRRDLEELLGERLRGVEIGWVERKVSTVLERFEQVGREHGFRGPRSAPALGAPALGAPALGAPDPGQGSSAPATGELVPAGEGARTPALVDRALPEGVASLVVAIRSRASRQFYEICEESGAPGGRGQRWAWNVLPALVVTLTVYAFIGTLVPQGVGPSAIAESLKGTIPLLEGALVSLLVACLIQWPVAERRIESRILHSLALLEGVVERAVEECLGKELVREPERVFGELLARHREFASLIEDAQRVLRDETSQKLRRSGVDQAPAQA